MTSYKFIHRQPLKLLSSFPLSTISMSRHDKSVMRSLTGPSLKFSSNSNPGLNRPPNTPTRACGVAETAGEAGPKYVSGVLGPLSWYGFS